MGIIVDVLATFLLILYGLLGQNVVLAIIAFTVIVRLAMLPLTLRQQRSMKRMQELSPKLKQLQAKYKDDREKMAQEQMALYREHGVNPFAGCLPLLVQLPIIFGLWRAIMATLASSPAQLLQLEDHILVRGLDHLVPLKNTFLWLNLALPDPYYILPVLVVITTYVQQKLIMPPTTKNSAKRKPGTAPDPTEQAEQMTRTMTQLMPLMFGFFALSYSSGLSIYFITANIIGIVQYAMMGKTDFRRLIGKERLVPTEEQLPLIEAAEAPAIVASSNGKRDDRERENGKQDVEEVLESDAVHESPSIGKRQLKPGFSESKLKPVSSAAAAAKVESKSSAGSKGAPRSRKKKKSGSKH